MYCPSCGTPNTQGLNYCNRCGANLVPASSAPVSRLAGLAWSIPLAMALITLGGLGMVFYIGLEMVRKGADIPLQSAAMLLVDVLVIVALDWMLLRQLSRVIDIYRPPGEQISRKQSELSGRQAAQIEAAREPVPFITEQTTRIFEPSSRERNR
jgi:hypothetical protein